MAFTFGVCAVATLFFGLAPALQATGIDLNRALQQSGAKSASSRGTKRLHSALVIAEVALSVVLVASAGLLLRSFQALLNVQLGYYPEKVTVMATDVPASNLESERQAAGNFTNNFWPKPRYHSRRHIRHGYPLLTGLCRVRMAFTSSIPCRHWTR